MAIKCFRLARELADEPKNWEVVDWERAIRVLGNSYSDPQAVIKDAIRDRATIRTPFSLWRFEDPRKEKARRVPRAAVK